MADLLGFTNDAAPAPDAVPQDYSDPFQGMPVQEAAPPMGDPFAAAGTPGGTGGRAIPEVSMLREWEDKHSEALEEMGRKEMRDKEAKRQEAAAQLAKHYADRNDSMTKKKASNRSEEDAIEKSKADGVAAKSNNSWELVADLIDATARVGDDGQDTSRMRALLIQLKTNPVAVAA